METRHEACSAEGQPRNILASIRTDSQAAAPRCHAAVIALSTAVVRFFTISHRFGQQRPLLAASRVAAVRDAAGLTRRQRDVRNCSGLAQARAFFAFINSKPRHGLPRAIESPLSREVALWVRKTTGMVFANWAGWPIERGEREARSGSMMLNIPTLWMVFVANYLALGLIWAYVARSYPKFEAARFWAGASFLGAAGATLATLHVFFPETLLPLMAGGTVMIFAGCLATSGINRFYGEPTFWRHSVLITASSAAAMLFFIYAYPSTGMRILTYSLGQMLPFVLSLKLLLSSEEGRKSPGARLAGIVTVVIVAIYAARAIGYFAHLGGEFSTIRSNPQQSVIMLVLMFLSLAWNFGFLLMAIDRLRNEVADLALLDDLTGVGNRRHLLARL